MQQHRKKPFFLTRQKPRVDPGSRWVAITKVISAGQQKIKFSPCLSWSTLGFTNSNTKKVLLVPRGLSEKVLSFDDRSILESHFAWSSRTDPGWPWMGVTVKSVKLIIGIRVSDWLWLEMGQRQTHRETFTDVLHSTVELMGLAVEC